MENNQYFEELKNRLGSYSGDNFDICADLMNYINSAPDEIQADLFVVACQKFGVTDSDKSYDVASSAITKTRRNELEEIYEDVVNKLFATCLKRAIQNQSEDVAFYKDIWGNIINNPIFAEPEEKLFAAYFILIDRRLPYFTISKGLSMENAEFQSILAECSEEIKKIKFILAIDFDQKTQEASNLLDIILNQSTYEKQVVLLSRVVSEMRREKNRLLEELKKMMQ